MKKVSFIVLTIATSQLQALEYKVQKNDTLWSLSKKYLKDPYQWPRIRKFDGSSVGNPRTMPVGLILEIPISIANQKAITELGNKNSIVHVSNEENPETPTKKAASVIYPFSYFISSDAEKVVIYRDGQFITIPVSMLEEKGVDTKSLGRNLNIDQSLLNKIFKKDI